MTLPVAILAGGLATRLHPLTLSTPKSLVDVAGQPFVAHQLRYLREQGVSEVVLCVGHLGDRIENVVGDGGQFDLTVRYSHEGERLLGTGGAVRKALDQLGPNFFVMYGDSFLRADFLAIERAFFESRRPALMTVYRNDAKYDQSNVLFRDGVIAAYDKRRPTAEMRHIDYGLGVFSADVVMTYDAGPSFDLADLYHDLAKSDRLAAFETPDRFYEIGSPAGLEETRRHLSTHGAAK